MIKFIDFFRKHKKREILLISAFFLILYLFLFIYRNYYLIGLWETNVIYNSFIPNADLLLPSIQKVGDTVGLHGLGYPLLGISKYFSKIFLQNTITIKLLSNIYGILSLILFFKIIFEKFGIKAAFCSTGLYLTNYYFQAMHGLLIAQPLTLFLIFLCVDRFNHFDEKKFSSYFLVALSSALLCMHYIIGRYVLIILFFYFVLNQDYFTNKMKKFIDIDKLVSLIKIILFTILILVIIYPPNLLMLFSKEMLLPFTAVGEHTSFEIREIYKSILTNFAYIYQFVIIGVPDEIGAFNLMLGMPFNISPKIFIFFFLVGIFSSAVQKDSFLFYILFFSILFLNLMSYTYPNLPLEISTTLSSLRLYILVPFYFFFSSQGILFIIEKLVTKLKIKKNYNFIFITLLILFNASSFMKEKNAYYNYVKNIKIDFSKQAKTVPNPEHMYFKLRKNLHYNQIYFFKVSQYVTDQIYINEKKSKNQKIKFLYLDEEYFTPSYYSYGGGIPTKGDKYYFPMFLSFYLNHKFTTGYLVNEKDKNFWLKKIAVILKNKDEFDRIVNTKSSEIVMALKFLRSFNNFFGGEIFRFFYNDKDNVYTIHNPSFFKKLSYVIISDKEQLDFVKENFSNEIINLR